MEDVSTNLWYYYYSAKIKKYLTRNSPISLHTVVLRLFRSKTRGRTTRDENETKLRANLRFQSLSFPRRFPIIRYLTRVPLSRSYVTQQRVSVRVFPKRFMNYVDGWVRGRGVCAYRGDPNASGLFWQNVVYRCGIWWIGICMEKKGLTFFVPFYRIIGTIIVADTSRGFFVPCIFAYARLQEISIGDDRRRWQSSSRWKTRFLFSTRTCLGIFGVLVSCQSLVRSINLIRRCKDVKFFNYYIFYIV